MELKHYYYYFFTENAVKTIYRVSLKTASNTAVFTLHYWTPCIEGTLNYQIFTNNMQNLGTLKLLH